MNVEIIIICFCLIYVIRILIIKIGSKKSRDKFSVTSPNSINLSFVSIVVPARNEENNIEHCINSILNSNYPADKFEIVIVNDRSSDNTANIISALANKHNSSNSNKIKICNITQETVNPNLKGKPGAIQAGIDMASGKIIMMTDADCIVNANWLKTISQNFNNTDTNNTNTDKKNIGMVCSYTNVKSNNIFHYFQANEWAYMHTYACAGIGLNTVLGCFGNNISITKEAYNHIGGFDNLEFSVTEDFVLLNAIFNAGYQIKYLCNIDSVVETSPVDTFKEYLVQRKRWAIGGIDLGWKAFVYVLSSVCLWFAIFLSIFSNNYTLLALPIILRFLGDALILFPVFNVLDIKYLKKWVPLSVCFYSLIELILPFTLLSKNVNWKGQSFKVK